MSISGLFSLLPGLNLSGISLKKRLRHNEINGKKIYVHPNHKKIRTIHCSDLPSTKLRLSQPLSSLYNVKKPFAWLLKAHEHKARHETLFSNLAGPRTNLAISYDSIAAKKFDKTIYSGSIFYHPLFLFFSVTTFFISMHVRKTA